MEALKNTAVRRAAAAATSLPSLSGLPLTIQVMVKNLERSTPHERLGDRDRMARYIETYTQKDISEADGAALNAHLAVYGLSPITAAGERTPGRVPAAGGRTHPGDRLLFVAHLPRRAVLQRARRQAPGASSATSPTPCRTWATRSRPPSWPTPPASSTWGAAQPALSVRGLVRCLAICRRRPRPRLAPSARASTAWCRAAAASRRGRALR